MKRAIYFTLITGLLAAASSQLSATILPYRQALNRNSRAVGIGRTELPLLQRQPGRGAKLVAAELLSHYRESKFAITTSGQYTANQTAKRIRYVGASGWYLQVYGDGTAIRYRNYPYLESAANVPLPLSHRIPDDKLEALARSFIATELWRYVQLSNSDGLQAFSTIFEIDGSQPNIPGVPVREEIVATAVNFIRTVDGVPVVGRGSKVSVIFANDGTPIGFDLDWPTYSQTGELQSILSPARISERASKVMAVNPFGPRTTIRRFECGYYDDGARRRDPAAPVQTACFMQYVVTSVGDPERNKLDPTDGLESAGYLGAVPAGVTVKADKGWSQAMKLCSGQPGCGVALRSSPPADDPKPVGTPTPSPTGSVEP